MRQFDKIAEVQSDKATVEITSRYDGVIKKLHYAKGTTAKVGTPLVDLEVEGNSQGPTEQSFNAPTPAPKLERQVEAVVNNLEELKHPNNPGAAIKAMPGVRHFARINGVDIGKIPATGRSGQITKEDVQKYMANGGEKRTITDWGEFEMVPLNAFQKAMERSMKAALMIPHFGFHDEIALDKLTDLRSGLVASVEDRHEIRMTMMAFFIKALSLTLSNYPVLNSHFDPTAHALKHFKSHNVGVAVDTDHGLAVPVIHGVQDLSIIDIARELGRLSAAARENRLTQSELAGGTITLSNIGSIGGTTASPVIVAPQVCIAALGRTRLLPRFDANMNIVPQQVLPVSWSADHRVIDGATVARFSQRWRQILENPSSLLLHLTQS